MKATGIVRRIDDLGRVVIPKEIRRTLRIREGDPLEIFTDREGGVILKKYSPIGELTDFSKEYAESLQQSIGHIVLISDKDAFISASGVPKKDYIDRKISNELESIMEARKPVLLGEGSQKVIPLHTDEEVTEMTSQVVAPIIAEGDAIGAVIILSKKSGETLGELELPGWDTSYEDGGLKALLDQYKDIDEEALWNNLNYFIQRIMKVAEEVRVKMAIHPDDPPWGIFGLPRIITNFENLKRFIDLYDSPYHGITLCTGSLGCTKVNDIVEMINYFGKERNRIHFAHLRNVKITGDSFNEVAHLSEAGSLDFYEIVKAYCDYDFDGPYRPDHGRMIWGETGRPGYGLYDRALGAVYINGLIEAINKGKN